MAKVVAVKILVVIMTEVGEQCFQRFLEVTAVLYAYEHLVFKCAVEEVIFIVYLFKVNTAAFCVDETVQVYTE